MNDIKDGKHCHCIAFIDFDVQIGQKNKIKTLTYCVQSSDMGQNLGILRLTDNSLTRSIDVTINNFLPDS